MRSGHIHEAIAHLEEALAALPPQAADRAPLRLHLAEALQLVGQDDDAQHQLTLAEADATTDQDRAAARHLRDRGIPSANLGPPALRLAVSETTSVPERLRLLTSLVDALPADAHNELQQRLQELDALLLGAPDLDLPNRRVRLAAAWLRTARAEPSSLEAAWRQVELAHAADPEGRSGWPTLAAQVRLAQLQGAALGEYQRVCALAGWFLEPGFPPPSDWALALAAPARWLLHAGPFAHPDTLELAGRLLRVAANAPDAEALRGRLAWIKARIGAVRSRRDRGKLKDMGPPPRELSGPWDGAPTWLIGLAQGLSTRSWEAPNPADFPLILALLEARPDRADEVLKLMVQMVSRDVLPAHAVAELANSNRYGLTGQTLLDAIEAQVTRRPTHELIRLRAQLYGESSARGTPEYKAAVDALVASATTPEEQVQAGLAKGIERMRAATAARYARDDEADAILAEARTVLAKAVEGARSPAIARHTRFQTFVSAGNAWRLRPGADAKKALELYEEAGRIGGGSDEERARLAKVTADALLMRDGPGDASRALQLVERALALRKVGYTRAETLLTAADVEERLPDRPAEVALARAAARLEEALAHDDGRNRLATTQRLIGVLGRLVLVQPRERRWRDRLTVLGERTPELRDEAGQARDGKVRVITREQAQGAGLMLTDPALRPMFDAVRHLERLDVEGLTELLRTQGLPVDQARPRLEEYLRGHQKTPDELYALAVGLGDERDHVRRPGALVGRARLLGYLVQLRRATPSEGEKAANEAEHEVRTLPAGPARRALLAELAKVWQPRDHAGHPLRDFRRSAEMLVEVVETCTSSETHLRLEAMSNLARATRYRTDGDRATYIKEAVRLFDAAERGYERIGIPSAAAHARMNASEARSALLVGGELASLRDSVDATRTYLARAQNNAERAHGQATLAMNLVCLHDRLPFQEKEVLLAEAVALYDQLDWSLIHPGARASAENYQTIARADLAWVRRDHVAAVALWRARMEALPKDTHPTDWAITAHNLGAMLTRPEATLEECWEGLTWYHRALQVRTLPEHALHHWETCQNIGRVILAIFNGYPEEAPWVLPLAPDDLWRRGRQALTSALTAARLAAGPERTLMTAQDLLLLSSHAPDVAELEESAETAWQAMDAAMPFLLRDGQASQAEAQLTAAVAGDLAAAYASAGPIGEAEGVTFCYGGKRARHVLPWLARSTGAAQRRLTARLVRPGGVSPDLWVRWRHAVRADDRAELEHVIPALRECSPRMLSGQPDLAQTEAWIASSAGSALVAVVETASGLIATVWEHGRAPQIARLAVSEPCPVEEDVLVSELTAEGEPATYRELLSWTRRYVLEPVQRLLHRTPERLLWLAPGHLRLLSPVDLWPGVAVTCTTRLDLSPIAPHSRPHRAFIAVADPGVGASSCAPLPGAVQSGARLARTLGSGRALRVRLGSGPASGPACGVSCPGLVDGGPTPEAVLRELKDADVAVFLCHGEVSGPDAGHLLLLGEDGTPRPLDLEELALDPQRLAGLTVVMLACEAGQVGAWAHRAGGLAGVFLCAGAREVIAPLWPVRLDPAVSIGEAILRAVDEGGDLAAALRSVTSADEHGPVLGERRTREQRHAELRWSLRAFVHWRG